MLVGVTGGDPVCVGVDVLVAVVVGVFVAVVDGE